MEKITRPSWTEAQSQLVQVVVCAHIHLILTSGCACITTSFRPKLAIVHSDIAGLQREATLAIYQPICFSSIAVIISSIMSISSKNSGCLKSSQVADMSYTKRILTHNLFSLQERNEQSFTNLETIAASNGLAFH
jgi:hypothetical protein